MKQTTRKMINSFRNANHFLSGGFVKGSAGRKKHAQFVKGGRALIAQWRKKAQDRTK